MTSRSGGRPRLDPKAKDFSKNIIVRMDAARIERLERVRAELGLATTSAAVRALIDGWTHRPVRGRRVPER